MDLIKHMPVETFMPVLLMRHLGSAAKTFNIASDFIEYGFDTEMIYAKYRNKSKRKTGLLKEINSKFSEPEEDELSHAFSLIIDENAINSFLLDFVLVDESISVRQMLIINPKTIDMVD